MRGNDKGDIIDILRDLSARVRMLETVDPPLEPPAQNPIPIVIGHANMLSVAWPPVENATEYEVHLGHQPDFVPDLDMTHVYTTASTAAVITMDPDGTLLDYDVPYYVKLVAKNPRGSAPLSQLPAPGATLQLADKDIKDLSADKITAGEIKSGVLVSGRIYSPAYEGWRVEIGDADFPIRFWDGTTTHFSVGSSGEVFISAGDPWKVELGDPDFPLRYWDGADTRFSVDDTGQIYAQAMTIENDAFGAAVKFISNTPVQGVFWTATDVDSIITASLSASNTEGTTFSLQGIIDVLSYALPDGDDVFFSVQAYIDDYPIVTGQIRLRYNPDVTVTTSPTVYESRISGDPNGIEVWAVNTVSGTPLGAGLLLREMSGDPAAPPANKVYFYAKDNGAGKTGLYARFNTGAVQQVALEP